MPIFSPEGPQYISRVHQNGRLEDPKFRPDEPLYHRFRKDLIVAGKVTPLEILPFRSGSGPSVNRGKYSEPCDVLEPDCCDGHDRSQYRVLEFRVEDVPKQIEVNQQNGRNLRFCLKHVPHSTCFSHSEIRCYTEDESGVCIEPPPSVRRKLRAEVARRASIRDCIPSEGHAVQGAPPKPTLGTDSSRWLRLARCLRRIRTWLIG